MFWIKGTLMIVGGVLTVVPVANKYLDSEELGKGTVILTIVGTVILGIAAILPF